MRILIAIMIMSCLTVGLPKITRAQIIDDAPALEEEFEEPLEEEQTVQEEEELPPEEEVVEEEEVIEEEPEEDVVPLPRLPFSRRRPSTEPAEEGEVFVGESDEVTDETRKVTIFAEIKLSYVFAEGVESLIMTHRFNLEGDVKARTAVMRGKAKINSTVEGFLFKNPQAECKLTITIPDAPYQLTFRRKDDENADINLKFTKPILETWESRCEFPGSGAKPFITTGEPEKWLNRVLAKTSPPLNRLVATLSADEKTTTKFVINTQQINDPPLGTIEAEGTGVITVIPAEALRQSENP